MKSGMIWMALAVAVLVSTSAWAWDPDGDASLVFNMNFEVYNNAAHTTDTAKPAYPDQLVGTVYDYNTTNPDVFGETSAAGLGFDANFAAMHDLGPGAGIVAGVSSPNDVKLKVSSWDPIFNLSSDPSFDLANDKFTWTFWFNVPNINDGTVLRHAHINYPDGVGAENLMWEIRIYGGKLQFYHRNNSLRMETASSLGELGVTVNTWHHAAVVIDRSNAVETSFPTTQLSCKLYVDGLEAPITVGSLNNTLTMNVDTAAGPADLWIGAGEREFDGLLDDVRLFSRDLTALEVSILNQPDKTKPVALLPIPRSSNVVATTGVSWVPSTSAPTAQKLYFGTNTDANLLPLKKSGNGAMNSATNGEISGPLARNIKYYWYIKSTIGGVDVDGPLWSFTTETGKAINPTPRDGAQDVNDVNADLYWTTPSPATYTVYASADPCQVRDSNVIARIANGISDPYIIGYDPCLKGATIYWRVNSTYPSGGGTIAGDIWSFRTSTYEVVFNTSGVETIYADHNIPAYTCQVHANGWSDACATGTLASDGVVVFNFPNGFNYDKRYDIIVGPEYRATDICSPTNPQWFPTPLAIHVTGDFYFDGRVQIAGDDILTTTQANTFARSGGFPGPKNNQDSSVFSDRGGIGLVPDYWNSYLFNPGDTSVIFHTRFNNTTANSGTAHYIYEPTALAKSTFGPGQPVNPPYKGGGGGGYGGIGGDSGRGYFFGVDTRGPSYGDKEVPVPFGGSAGGWGGSNSPGGAAGGGGIEIVADGNMVLDSNSQILAHGGSQLCSSSGYPAGGGSGGSVKIIAGGSVTNKGIIDVNGGKGGDGTAANNTGGGGGGGRVAIFYGNTYTNTNTGAIAANGGARGTYSDPCYNFPVGLAQSGQNGTIYVVKSSTVSPKKASAPTPKNGDSMVYCNPSPGTIQLKWYSGYGGTTDVVYCDTNPNPTTSRGSVTATRGQHSVNMTVSAGNTYYMKVVTDGSVSSDTWSFGTVNWQCPLAVEGAYPHPAGLEWDSNHDCVIDLEDFDYFADDWLNSELGQYTLEFYDYNRFANEWRQCANRTDGGCAGF